MTPTDVLDLQRDAGNHAVAGLLRTVQRVGGWKDADKRPGKGLPSGPLASGWNVEEHAVGAIRRIPIDGLVHGLQNVPSADGGKSLTIEDVAGKARGPARSTPQERKGRGRAIALIPADSLDTGKPVDVLFHLHGNTEKIGREFAGWRQHSSTGRVRDVERDRIAQQIQGSGNPQLVGILPMGVNESQFGAISPDAYLRDAFARLTELGAWRAAPTSWRVALSAHSGGGFTIERMMKGRTGFQLPQKLGMIILFEANNNVKSLKRGEQQAFVRWALDQLNAHLAVLTSRLPDKQKRDYLAQATRLRAFFNPKKSYKSIYVPVRTAIDDWFQTNGTKLGTFLAETKSLLQVIEQTVGHEQHMGTSLQSALTALPGTPTAGPPTGGQPPAGGQQPAPAPSGTQAPRPAGGAAGSGSGSSAQAVPVAPPLSTRASAITAAMVGGRAGASAPVAMLAFTVARGQGAPPLQAAASALASAGVRDQIDLTDALFALVRQELGGGRIPADRNDLKQEWRLLRSSYVRPTLAPPTSDGAVRKPDGADRPAPSESTPVKRPVAAAGSPEEEYQSFAADVQKAFGKAGVKRYLEVRHLYATRKETAGNPAQWLNELRFGASFCGTKLNGVHPNLLTVLQKVDEEVTKLAARVRAAGAPVVFQGDFQPRPVTGKKDKLSDHALGLALHLNYKNNPYVGRNKAASALIARIAGEAGQEKFWSSIRGSGRKTSQARVEEIYAGFAAASDAVRKYFLEMDALQVKHDAGELDAAGQAELKRRKAEYEQLRTTDLAMGKKNYRDPRAGFFLHTMGVDGDPMLEIIKQLTGPAGLEWGGTYSGRAKDLHHFALKS